MNIKIAKPRQCGFTLVELAVVMFVLLTLVSTTIIGAGAYRDWQAGLEAGESLKAVYQAQRLYLADNPTTSPAALDATDVLAIRSYLPGSTPNNLEPIPSITGLDGVTYTINATSVPPEITGYDDQTADGDGLWDVGE